MSSLDSDRKLNEQLAEIAARKASVLSSLDFQINQALNRDVSTPTEEFADQHRRRILEIVGRQRRDMRDSELGSLREQRDNAAKWFREDEEKVRFFHNLSLLPARLNELTRDPGLTTSILGLLSGFGVPVSGSIPPLEPALGNRLPSPTAEPEQPGRRVGRFFPR